ncbi:aminotransferase class I/II-fold pyridoxal phosphate-dependent enzyme [Alkalicoccobacillus porphyridii]|uniref:Aminotransferase class I/II-fold pyridoxal phosphate-dependent enzyme n=1 Tax=Alkalicoccobacillus porphyridii TaxID=2597270 RepID=A0A553ZXP5_9BACI|nr:aminotransferase class I/II-fold pyridoxal phosphate-dependent enzyme [Alkalicoccobacillus porphyridii]TSB46213.1 aminotransferase class I/II-fold pyridoxal phosphate-dependent enzyme [Alkalicoccobacillus porphyridii]
MSKSINTIIDHLAEITGYDRNEIEIEKSLVNDLGLDSMMVMDLHRLLLNDFPEIKEVNLEKIFEQEDTTVYTIISLIQSKKGVEERQEPVSIIENFIEIQEFNEYINSKQSVPYFKENDGIASNKIMINGEEKINFSTYNYLGINGALEINTKVTEAINKYGTSVSGSRLLSGEIKIHKQLEQKISDFLGVDDALIQVGGHSTNVNTIGNIVNQEDLILHDSLAHNSIIQGAILSNAKRKSFKHNDMNHLESELDKLRPKFRRVLIIVEGVYSMDGDICRLPELIAIKEKYNAILMVDEAHSLGTIGKNGKGVTSYFNVNPKSVDILMGTLSKSLNSCGGYIAGNANFIKFLRYNSPGFIFSVGITPANAAAALASLTICESSEDLFIKLKENHTYFLNELIALGMNTGESYDSPIVPLIIGHSDEALTLSEKLYDNGINAMPIVYPAVKESESRIRFFISASHTRDDLDHTLMTLKKLVRNEESSLVSL